MTNTMLAIIGLCTLMSCASTESINEEKQETLTKEFLQKISGKTFVTTQSAKNDVQILFNDSNITDFEENKEFTIGNEGTINLRSDLFASTYHVTNIIYTLDKVIDKDSASFNIAYIMADGITNTENDLQYKKIIFLESAGRLTMKLYADSIGEHREFATNK
ncbi:MAG: hypothetical protein ACRCTJ_03025 [Brevinema sp.]